jgi:hypothetical protein
MRKVLLATLTSFALFLPVQAQRNAYRHREDRYYDREHRDYHSWNEREARAWHRYWEERHRREIAWERAKERQRREYWKWRHEHMNY